MRHAAGRIALATLALVACKATTSRPSFVPFPEAGHGEIGFGNPDRVATITQATQVLAEALRADSIPVARVHVSDGYLETGWFDAASLTPTGRRPLGPEVVKVRGWVDPAKPGFSDLEVETVYVPYADPSRPERDLEAPVAADHPVATRVAGVIKALVEKFGEPDTTTVRAAAPGAKPPVADTGARPAASGQKQKAAPAPVAKKVVADSAKKAPPDTTRPFMAHFP